MRLQQAAHERIALKDGVTSLKRRFQLFDVQCLQVAANVTYSETTVCPQRFNQISRPKTVVFAVEFSRTRRAAVEEHQLPEPIPHLRVARLSGSSPHKTARSG